jgi:hypothetical protein
MDTQGSYHFSSWLYVHNAALLLVLILTSHSGRLSGFGKYPFELHLFDRV